MFPGKNVLDKIRKFTMSNWGWGANKRSEKTTLPLPMEADPLSIPENDDKGEQGHLDEEDRGVLEEHLDEEEEEIVTETPDKVGHASENRSRYDQFKNTLERNVDELDENEVTTDQVDEQLSQLESQSTMTNKELLTNIQGQSQRLDQILTPVATGNGSVAENLIQKELFKNPENLQVPGKKSSRSWADSSRSGSRCSRVSTLSKASRTSSQKRKTEDDNPKERPKPKRTNTRTKKKREKEYKDHTLKNPEKCSCVEFPSFVCPIEDHNLPSSTNTSKCDDDNEKSFTPVGKNGKPLKQKSSKNSPKPRDYFLKSN